MTNDAPCTVFLDGRPVLARAGQPLIEFLEEQDIELPHICYHPALGALQTCDVCWVQVGGELKRACTLTTSDGLRVDMTNHVVQAAQHEGMDRLLSKHELYCTLCENNTGDCTLHNTMAAMEIPIQRYEYQRSPYAKDESNPFYTYDADQCIACGRCVEACQNLQVNETLTIDFNREYPRVQRVPWQAAGRIAASVSTETRRLRPSCCGWAKARKTWQAA